MTMLPTFYKLGSGRRGAPCLLCMTRTPGPTSPFHIGFGEIVHLCEGHSSREFRRQRGGRDFYLSVSRALQAAGALTKTRDRGLRDLWNQTMSREQEKVATRARPGSYAWPELRRIVEDACRRGVVSIAKLRDLITAHLRSELRRGRVRLPSDRTLRRWRAERRWDLADDPT